MRSLHGGSQIGLRVDVDTLRGTQEGVPRLLEIFDRHQLHASFFVSVGPDHMGRHLWRMWHPKFFHKLCCSRATQLYGWDILTAGTLWPGKQIASRCAHLFREIDALGHEIGLHAWDHYAWQCFSHRWSSDRAREAWMRGWSMLKFILPGNKLQSSAAPGWRVTETILAAIADQVPSLLYQSDCRGRFPFYPWIASKGAALTIPQIPVTLPTFDEVLGRQVTVESFNLYLTDVLLTQLKDVDCRPVYTIHAEVEGRRFSGMFSELLSRWKDLNIHPVPLGRLLVNKDAFPTLPIRAKEIPGRAGWVACQGSR